MRLKRFSILAGGLILVSLIGCSPQASPSPSATTILPPTASSPVTARTAVTPSSEPTSTPQIEATSSSPMATLSTTRTPKLDLTAVPLTPDEIITKEEKVTDRTTPVPTPPDPGLQKLVGQAKEDLAQRLGLTIEEIDLIELKYVVWPDRGLGCPKPGMVYPQVPEDGMLIQLKVGKHVYNYHVGLNRPPFLCEQSTP